jgi:hypothetical protein
VIDVLVLGTMAACLAFLGRWGIRNPETLVTGAWSELDREHRIAVVRRGARGCLVVAGVVALLAVLAVG